MRTMNQEIQPNPNKELTKPQTFEEARTILDDTLAEIEENRTETTITSYYHDNGVGLLPPLAVLSLSIGTAGLVISIGLGVSMSMGASIATPLTPVIIPTVLLTLVGVISVALVEFNGSPNQKFGNFLAKTITTKKKRKELQAHQQNIADKQIVQEVFKTYVAIKNQELKERGVWAILNDNDSSLYHYLDVNGEYQIAENHDKKTEQAVNRMLKTITASTQINA